VTAQPRLVTSSSLHQNGRIMWTICVLRGDTVYAHYDERARTTHEHEDSAKGTTPPILTFPWTNVMDLHNPHLHILRVRLILTWMRRSVMASELCFGSVVFAGMCTRTLTLPNIQHLLLRFEYYVESTAKKFHICLMDQAEPVC
jgi:hypothetical protein